MRLTPWWLNPYLLGLIVLLAGAGWVYWKGGKEPRQEVKALTQAAKDTAKSNEVSRSTQERIGIEGYETQRQSDQRVGRVQDRIAATPDAGQLDAGILRESREAWEAAVRSACRLQRTSDCPPASASARKH